MIIRVTNYSDLLQLRQDYSTADFASNLMIEMTNFDWTAPELAILQWRMMLQKTASTVESGATVEISSSQNCTVPENCYWVEEIRSGLEIAPARNLDFQNWQAFADFSGALLWTVT